MARPTRRETLLDAAQQVVRRAGAAHLTLDAVAAEAGTSKGGLLYHFATKDDLVAAMIERLVASFDRAVATTSANDPDPTGRWTRAYVRATAGPDGPSDDDGIATALLAAIGTQPALAEPLRRRYADWHVRLAADGLPGVDALVVGLAADGLWMADLLELDPPSGDTRRQVIERLNALAGGAS
jgi:AcrR family transcriptional regulator